MQNYGYGQAGGQGGYGQGGYGQQVGYGQGQGGEGELQNLLMQQLQSAPQGGGHGDRGGYDRGQGQGWGMPEGGYGAGADRGGYGGGAGMAHDYNRGGYESYGGYGQAGTGGGDMRGGGGSGWDMDNRGGYGVGMGDQRGYGGGMGYRDDGREQALRQQQERIAQERSMEMERQARLEAQQKRLAQQHEEDERQQRLMAQQEAMRMQRAGPGGFGSPGRAGGFIGRDEGFGGPPRAGRGGRGGGRGGMGIRGLDMDRGGPPDPFWGRGGSREPERLVRNPDPAPRGGRGRGDRGPKPVQVQLRRNNDDRPGRKGDSANRPGQAGTPRKGAEGVLDKNKYTVRLTTFSFTQKVRDYTNIKTRYPNLHIANDFRKVVCLWPESEEANGELQMEHDASYYYGTKKDGDLLKRIAPYEKKSTMAPIKYNAKLMMFKGLPEGAMARSAKDLPHITKQIKFLITKSQKSGISCLGGAWSADKDGGGEVPDDQALIRAAVRHTKDMIDVDLSGVKKWFKFMEIHYHRPAEVYKGRSFPEQEEITTFFLPAVWEIVPSVEQYEVRLAEVRKYADEQAVIKWKEDEAARVKAHEEARIKYEEAKAKAAAAEAKAAAAIAAAEEKAAAAKLAAAAEGKLDVLEADKEEPKVDAAVAEAKKEEEEAASKTNGVPALGDPLPAPGPCVLDSPKDPCIVCRPRRDPKNQDVKTQMRLLLVSLDGLLDYNLEDIFEKTFEASLFAELFNEMLQHRSAKKIVEGLRVVQQAAVMEEAAIRKAALDMAEKTTGIKRKAEGDDKGDAKKAKAEDKKDEEEGDKAAAPEVDESEYVKVEKAEADKEEHFHVEEDVDQPLRAAWQLFDRGGSEFIRGEDVEQIVHNLGMCYSKKQVSDLVEKVVHGRRVNYMKLTCKEKLVWDGIKDSGKEGSKDDAAKDDQPMQTDEKEEGGEGEGGDEEQEEGGEGEGGGGEEDEGEGGGEEGEGGAEQE